MGIKENIMKYDIEFYFTGREKGIVISGIESKSEEDLEKEISNIMISNGTYTWRNQNKERWVLNLKNVAYFIIRKYIYC